MRELTLPERLQEAAGKYPDLGITYMKDDGSTEFQSYPVLLAEALELAGGFSLLGLKAGDKAIIATSGNRQTVTLVWAAFLSGIVPTILQPPVTFSDYNPAAAKLLNIFNQLDKPYIFLSEKGHSQDPQLKDRIIAYPEIQRTKGAAIYTPGFDELAFIQFSSGSTGDPKGIMLSHRNLSANIAAIIKGIDLQPHDHGGNWMPLYHDMGLIGYHLTPVYCPCNQYHIETIDFIKNPGLWLDMIHKQRITVTGCPNFGQALVVRYLKRKSGSGKWDLSPVKAMLNGAEPISLKVLDEFTRAMKAFGFHEESMMPVYGLAEATLAISFSPLMKPSIITAFDSEILDKQKTAVRFGGSVHSKQSRSIISVGTAIQSVEIRIVDDENHELPECSVGHIQVKGDNVSKGYYLQPDSSRSAFEGDWLKTGDMGFFFEGNLYISGRFKDIIFMNGKNYFAHDLENLACTLEEINYGKVIFGGVTDPKTGKEKVLAFVAGVSETAAPEVLHKLRSLLRKNLGILLDELILIRSNEIPKTSSGKIQRYQVIQRYQLGEFRETRFK